MGESALRLDGAEEPWARSSARYRIATEHEGSQLTVAVGCRIGGLPFEIQALLDTGAAWSVIGGDIADLLEARLGPSGQTMILSTRLGRIRGILQEIDVVLIAERGESLLVSGRILIAPADEEPQGYAGALPATSATRDLPSGGQPLDWKQPAGALEQLVTMRSAMICSGSSGICGGAGRAPLRARALSPAEGRRC